MIYVPPLHAELMSTTALTPTQHKGGVGRILSIAASIAIPIAAPAIVTSLAGSMLLTTAQYTLASTVVGTALGALAAKVTGQPIWQGALSGAFGGGLGGFAKAGGFSGIGGGYSPPTGAAAVTPLSPIPTPQFVPGAPITTGQGLLSAAPTAPGFAAGLDATTAFTVGGGVPFSPVVGGFNPAFVPEPGLIPSSSPGAVLTSTGGAQVAPGSFAAGLKDTIPAQTLSPIVRTASGGIAPGPAAPGFLDDLTTRLGEGVTKAFSPENLAQKGLEAAGQFGLSKAAEYFADDVPEEMSPDEEAFLRQQRAQQGRLLGEQEKIALQLANEARSVPVSGQAESNRAKIAAARAGQTYVRQGSQAPAARLARERRVTLAAARRGGTAQIQGRTGGLARRADLLTAAANVLPTGDALAASATADLAAADKAFLLREKALQEQRKNFVAVFGGLLPTGEDTDEEIEEAQARRT